MSEFYRAYMNTFFRGASAACSLLATFLYVRYNVNNLEYVATYFYVLAISSVTISIVSLGCNNLLLKYATRSKESYYYASKLWGVVIILLFSPIFSMLVFYICQEYLDASGLLDDLHLFYFIIYTVTCLAWVFLGTYLTGLSMQIYASLCELVSKAVILFYLLLSSSYTELLKPENILLFTSITNIFLISLVSINKREFVFYFTSVKPRLDSLESFFLEGLTIWPSQFIDQGIKQLPIILLNKYGLSRELVDFGFSMRVYNAFSLITGPLNQYVAPKLANAKGCIFKEVYIFAIKSMLYVILPLFFGVILCMQPLYTFFFGQSPNQEVILGTALISFSQVIYGSVGPIGIAMMMKGYSMSFTVVNAIVSAFVFSISFSLISEYGYLGACLVLFLPQVISNLVSISYFSHKKGFAHGT